jgi:O-antigen/teichoic acid export membrane protein
MLAPESARRVARNAIVPMAASLVGKALDLGFAAFYLRVLGPAGAADYAFLVIFATYLDTLVNFGLNTLVTRDVARVPAVAGSAFRNVSLVRLGLWLVALPAVAIVLGPARPRMLSLEVVPAGWLFFAALLPSILATTATGLLWARERLEIPAGVSVLTTILKVALGVLVLAAGYGLVGLATISVLLNVITAGLLLGLLARVSTGERENRREEEWANENGVAGPALAVTNPLRLVRDSWPLFVNQLLQGLFFKIDGMLLPALAGPRPAGAYAAAYKVIEGQGVISSSFTLAVFPRLARWGESPTDGLAAAYRLSLRFLLQVAVPLAAGTALLSEPIVALLAGGEFLPESAVALAVLAWFLPFSFANGLTQYVLIAVGRQRFLTYAFLVAFAFNLATNLALIPRFGFIGAASVTVASELVLMVPFLWAARRAVPGVSFLREMRHPALTTILMAPLVWWLRDTVHPLAAVVAGVLVYPAALWALGGIDHQQWTVLRAIVPRTPVPGWQGQRSK